MQFSTKARKAIASTLAASTVLMSSAAVIAPQVASAAVHSEGCLVLSGGIVWMITNGTRRGFTSAEVFQSYGYNFSQVVAATAEDVALPVGPIMIYADGTLVKGPNDPLVYLVAGGQKRGFVSGSVFTGLGFSFANIQQAPVNTFSDLPVGAHMDSTTMAHPDGVKVLYNGTVWEMTATGRMGFSSGENFLSYGYKFAHVVAANAADLAMPDQGIVPARPACTGGDIGQSGSVNVSLNGPAAGTLISTQANANLANFVFTGNGTVTGVTLKRIGVSADTSLSNVYLYDGSTRLTDAASVSSGSMITFNNASGLFTVSGSRTISVKATMAATAGETVGVQLTGATLASGSVGGVPVTGNLHTVAAATLATVALSGTVTVSGATNPGNDILLWQETATVSTRDVLFTRFALRQIGSINSADIRNFRLFVDGVQVASQQSLDANGYVTFTFSKTMQTGSRIIKVLGDVIGGSGRTVSMSLRGAYDMDVADSQYNAGIAVTSSGTFPETATAFTVSAGSMTVVKATDSQSSNLTVGASDQSLGKFTFTAYGESIKVETLLVDFTYDGSPGSTNNAAATLRNGRVLVNGSQVGSTTTLNPASSGTSFTTNFTVNPGTPVSVEVRSDMFDNDGTGAIDSSDTVVVTLSTGSSNGIPQTSLTPINVPTANVSANTLTISSASLALAAEATYGNRNVVVPQTAYKVAAFNLTNGNVEDVNVNTFTLTFTPGDGDDGGGTNEFTAADLTDVYIKYGANQTPVKATVAGSDAYSVSYSAVKNSVTPVEVYANISSAAISQNDTLIVNVAVSATSVSGQSANVSATAGQTLTAKTSGSITAALDGSTPVAAIKSDNSSFTAGTYSFTTVSDSYTITDVTVTIDTASPVAFVSLTDQNGATVGAAKPGATSVTWSGLNIPVASDSNNTKLNVVLQLGTVGTGAGATGASIQVALGASGVTARSNATGTSAVVSGLGGAIDASAMYAYASTPSIALTALPTSQLANSTVTLMKFTLTANGGDVGWKDILFTVSKHADPVITNATLWDVTGGGNSEVAGADTLTTVGATNTAGTILFVATNEQVVSSNKTYELRADVSGAGADDFISTRIAQPSTYAAPDDYTAANAVGTYSLVWSDRSGSGHSAASTTVLDWNNDYLVLTLPTSLQTLTHP